MLFVQIPHVRSGWWIVLSAQLALLPVCSCTQGEQLSVETSALWSGREAPEGTFSFTTHDGLCALTRVAHDTLMISAHCLINLDALETDSPDGPVPMNDTYRPRDGSHPGAVRKFAATWRPYRWTNGMIDVGFFDQDSPTGDYRWVGDTHEVKSDDVPAQPLTDDEAATAEVLEVAIHPSYEQRARDLMRRLQAGEEIGFKLAAMEPAIDIALVRVRWLNAAEQNIGQARVGSATGEVTFTGFRTGWKRSEVGNPWVWQRSYLETQLSPEKAAEHLNAVERPIYDVLDHGSDEAHDSGAPIVAGWLQPCQVAPDVVVGINSSVFTYEDRYHRIVKMEAARQFLLDHGIPWTQP